MRVGDAERNNDLTIIIYNPYRQIGIATRTGTELILTAKICKEIIDKTTIPAFKNGNKRIVYNNSYNQLLQNFLSDFPYVFAIFDLARDRQTADAQVH